MPFDQQALSLQFTVPQPFIQSLLLLFAHHAEGRKPLGEQNRLRTGTDAPPEKKTDQPPPFWLRQLFQRILHREIPVFCRRYIPALRLFKTDDLANKRIFPVEQPMPPGNFGVLRILHPQRFIQHFRPAEHTGGVLKHGKRHTVCQQIQRKIKMCTRYIDL